VGFEKDEIVDIIDPTNSGKKKNDFEKIHQRVVLAASSSVMRDKTKNVFRQNF
jgi:hypothetical protein